MGWRRQLARRENGGGELTGGGAASTLNKLTCRGSSVVERRPEKAGVASSILAPGTTRSRHRFFPEEIYFTVSKIHWFSVLNRGFQCERPEVFCEYCARHVNTLGVRDEFSNLG